MLIIIVPAPEKECPYCKLPSLGIKEPEHDYECPKCRGQFCSQCFKTIYDSDGSKVGCPHCEQILKFPKQT